MLNEHVNKQFCETLPLRSTIVGRRRTVDMAAIDSANSVLKKLIELGV
jgi:hypothetical protein